MGYKDKEAQRAYQRKWMKAKRERLLASLGGKCVKCGTTEGLEFDHVEHWKKTASVNAILSSRRVESEVEKCQVLCEWCHYHKTMTDFYWSLANCKCVECLPKLHQKEVTRKLHE